MKSICQTRRVAPAKLRTILRKPVKAIRRTRASYRRTVVTETARLVGSVSEITVAETRADAAFPVGVLITVTGVSGAGKSSLINGTLHPALRRKIFGSHDQDGA